MLATIVAGAAVGLPVGQEIVTPTGVDGANEHHNYQAVLSWDEAARNAKGIWTVAEPAPAPEGERIASTLLLVVFGAPTLVPTYEPIPLDELKAEKQAARAAAYQARVALGYEVGGLHVQIDDGSRANLSGMALTASLALQEITPWPADYARGWVTIERTRIPLPEPGDGITLSYGAGAHYSALVQHDADLEELIVDAPDAAALAAIDVTAGWP